MNRFVRTGIVTLAGTVALGTAGFFVAGAAQADDHDPVVKREDTASSWVQSTNLDDDPQDDRGTDDDSPTTNTKNTKNTKNTAPTKNTVNTVNTTPTRNTAPTTTGHTS
ncbi:MAG: hypothetical protein JWQ91_1128 [Aeromicrobium sp.]|jgi:hypothetical protein|uniref:hypothetical protein n=1 Tax=Aeromicrobium sp. TaxID=1871063 RepID=UPI002605B337|nr:hypothetical protein [Aeromicrobium sp.]MCW2824211.1 hypothetical protein [Aeromicrobium sp.]